MSGGREVKGQLRFFDSSQHLASRGALSCPDGEPDRRCRREVGTWELRAEMSTRGVINITVFLVLKI